MKQHFLNFKERIDSGEVIFEINREYFVTKKIYLLNQNGEKVYLVKLEYSVNESMRPIRDKVETYTDFQQAYDYYIGANTTHNLYTKAGKAKIEEDKAKQPEVIFENEVIQMVDINSIVLPETGKTSRQTNLEKEHSIPLGSLVELEDGIRLYVVGHPRDFDGTPLYNLCFDKNWKEEEDYKLGDQVILAKMMSRKMLVMHYPKESLKLIRSSSEESLEKDFVSN
jgi:hypothetical protein